MFPETVEFDENVAFDVNFNVNSTIDIDTWAVPDPSDPNCGGTCPAICTDLVLNRSRIGPPCDPTRQPNDSFCSMLEDPDHVEGDDPRRGCC